MKSKVKIILLIISILLLSSCDSIIVHMDGWATPVNSNDKKFDVSLYEYNGHTYFIFGETRAVNGVVHDPDCICNTNNKK